MDNNSPIGVFDSGVGGLTVVREILRVLPDENLIYLGDTARVPYGTKSSRTVINYSQSNARFLISKGVKLLVVACNTASAVALPSLRWDFEVPVIGVIEPGVRKAVKTTKRKKIGVIGTQSTIKSNAYKKAIENIAPEIEVYSKACPLFVPLAEEGWLEGEVVELIAGKYLESFKECGIDVLILGCTHYPLLKPVIKKVMGPEIELIDSATETALEIRRVLLENGLARTEANSPVLREFYLTDVSESFIRIAERFLGSRITQIELVDIKAEIG
ncbi:Glutamate racemase [bacterium HR37]|jgi:glutamate racemase|nr:Glutamate racemase [bacterium HR37]